MVWLPAPPPACEGMRLGGMEWAIVTGDAIAEMGRLYAAGERFDAVITSPPYNLRNSTGGQGGPRRTGRDPWASGIGDHRNAAYAGSDDAMPKTEYVEWQRECVRLMLALLADDGALFYNHKERPQAGCIEEPALDILAGQKWPLRQRIVWARSGGLSHNHRHLTSAHEYVYLVPGPQWRVSVRGPERLSVWSIQQTQKVEHPAPFPPELARRCCAAGGGVRVLDPFCGAGSTLIGARDAGAEYALGIEISPEYVAVAQRRMGERLL